MTNRIRKGGIQTPSGYLFEFSGGDTSLDFVNTLDSRPTPYPRELLLHFTDLLSWSRQAGLLDGKHELLLRNRARRNPAQAERAGKFARSVRECMFNVFYHLTENLDFSQELIKEWNRFVHKSAEHYEMVPAAKRLRWDCVSEKTSFNCMLWPIVHAAMELLTSNRSDRIRRCASPKCDWMFLDTSKRGNRRWCDMTVCGNRAKASRFYSRKKERA